eukprot:4935303-Prymnesium_polylepis.1
MSAAWAGRGALWRANVPCGGRRPCLSINSPSSAAAHSDLLVVPGGATRKPRLQHEGGPAAALWRALRIFPCENDCFSCRSTS